MKKKRSKKEGEKAQIQNSTTEAARLPKIRLTKTGGIKTGRGQESN